MRFTVVSALVTVIYLAFVGVIAAVIPNPLFERMTPVTGWNLVFWVVPALLVGPLVASYLVPGRATACDVTNRATLGGILSFLAVGCPVCNKAVVLLLGVSGALTYFEPLQPALGALSVALLGYGLWLRFGVTLRRAPAPET